MYSQIYTFSKMSAKWFNFVRYPAISLISPTFISRIAYTLKKLNFFFRHSMATRFPCYLSIQIYPIFNFCPSNTKIV